MTEISFSRREMISSLVRDVVGERTVDIFREITQNEKTDDETNIVTWLIGAGERLVGFILGAISRAGQWLISKAVPFLIRSALTLFDFDWNASDSAIFQMIASNNQSIAASLGRLIGGGSVWLISIGLATAASLRFPVLGGKVALALSEEGGEEIRGYLLDFINQTTGTLINNFFLFAYYGTRRLLRYGVGLNPTVADNNNPWTIAGGVENLAGKVPAIGTWLKTAIESAIEEAYDAVTEVGFVISYAIDDYYESAKLAQEIHLGEHRTVKLQPDSRVSNEFITLSGDQKLLEQNIQSAVLSHRLIHNRDLGQLVGQPAEDWLRAGTQRRKLTVVFKSKSSPPWVAGTGQDRVKEVSYSVPDVKTGLTWRSIKTAAKHYTWGKFRCTANLDNGRQMAVYGATPAEAEEKLRDLLNLSTAEILTLSVTEEKDRHPNLKKSSTEMFPAYATLLIRRSTAEITGSNDLSGNNYRDEHIRLDLWPDEEPDNLQPLQ